MFSLRMPWNWLRRATGIAPWGVTPQAARGERFAAGPPQGESAPWGQRPAQRRSVGASFAAGPPQGESAPLGGSDPRSGGAWGRYRNQPRLRKYSIGPRADSAIRPSANGYPACQSSSGMNLKFMP